MTLDPKQIEEWKRLAAITRLARDAGACGPGNESFFALAAEAVPALIAEVERLQSAPVKVYARSSDALTEVSEACRLWEGRARKAEADAERQHALLREVEWTHPAGVDCLDACPVCHGLKPHMFQGRLLGAHAPDCRLAAAIREG